MKRKACEKRGHKFRTRWVFFGPTLPYVFCTRWFCEGSEVADWVWETNPRLALDMHNAIPQESR